VYVTHVRIRYDRDTVISSPGTCFVASVSGVSGVRNLLEVREIRTTVRTYTHDVFVYMCTVSRTMVFGVYLEYDEYNENRASIRTLMVILWSLW
jgi:hypothetical protein